MPRVRHSIDGHDEAIALAIASRTQRMRASLSHLLERLFGREDRDLGDVRDPRGSGDARIDDER